MAKPKLHVEPAPMEWDSPMYRSVRTLFERTAEMLDIQSMGRGL